MDARPYPIARIGIIGGGQLGRMMVQAAHRLGCTCVVLDPTPSCPAGQVSGHQIVGDFHDPARLRELVESCDVSTFDIEDIGSDTLIELESEGNAIHPSPKVLAEIQDKLTQKRMMAAAGIPTAEFIEMPTPDADAFAQFGYPLVQKARRGGYDGRGVAVMHSADDFPRNLPVPALIERFIPASKELAVLVARGSDGETRCYPPVEMVFRSGENVLDLLLAPASISSDIADAAQALAIRTVDAMGAVGIFGIEMFLTADNNLLVNEIAPRTHNSGHHTIEACVTDQFEQHLRAILGLPLGSTEQLSPAAMINLLGAPDRMGRPVIQGMAAALALDGVSVHLYGKASTTPFRKMGHITVLDANIDDARRKAEKVRDTLIISGENHP
ncbi:MAG: 5-(carboxyamino)imidazole ribonucleotide synthase [Gammaproteobacteria bacterium]|nr:5-(carboxyamino)imidazole ribonucleotide synthase [Gammaproteobacteria bacterium]MCP5135700.1 5-(carboxyamino)imidazole ribonucleotide synthase [Gammaproteobacteria bacterium]